ncbi:MAG: hypothetical protein KKB79_01740 [Nanoarchaeota archaeon]|nr:hypothetical protein [Nanoarchaeota archaeon]
MINSRVPLSMSESVQYISDETDFEVEMKKFIKKFTKMNSKKVEELRKELEGLNLIRLRPEHAVKIVDIMPEDQDSLNKIFEDSKVSDDEANSILQTVKKFK